jgi:DNA-binding NtrC family response regulator
MNAQIHGRQGQLSRVLVVFPGEENRAALTTAIAEAGSVPLVCQSLIEAQEAMKHEIVHTILCEDQLSDRALEAILKLAKHRRRPIPVIVCSRTGEWEEFLRALRRGVFEYLVLPPQTGEVKRVLELAMAEVADSGPSAAGRVTPRDTGIEQLVCSFEDFRDNSLGQDSMLLQQVIPSRNR